MKKIFILLIIFITSCNYEGVQYVCNCEERKQVDEFISKNIKSSNNMSDEEMEDVIKELYKTAVKIKCKQKLVLMNSKGYYLNGEKLDSCEQVMFNIY